MTDSNRTRTSLIAEVTPGTTPSTPTLLVLPKAAFSGRDAIGYVESDIIRNDANVQSVQKVSEGISGTIETELQYSVAGDAMLALIAAALGATETAAATQVTGVTSSSNVLSGGSGNVETGCEVGDVVRVLDSSDVLLGYFKVGSINVGAHTMTLVGGTLANGSNRKVQRGARMKNGTTETHFSIEHARPDGSLYQMFRGCGIGGFTLRVADEQITRLSFPFEGMSSALATSEFGSAYTDPTPRESIAAVSVPVFRVGDGVYECQELSLAISRSLQARRKIGAQGPTSIRRGMFRVTGSTALYLDSWTELAKYKDGTNSDLWFVLQDAARNAWSFSVPRLKWTDGSAETRGKDQDDFARLQFQAELDPTELISLRSQRWAAP